MGERKRVLQSQSEGKSSTIFQTLIRLCLGALQVQVRQVKSAAFQSRRDRILNFKLINFTFKQLQTCFLTIHSINVLSDIPFDNARVF